MYSWSFENSFFSWMSKKRIEYHKFLRNFNKECGKTNNIVPMRNLLYKYGKLVTYE